MKSGRAAHRIIFNELFNRGKTPWSLRLSHSRRHYEKKHTLNKKGANSWKIIEESII